MNDHENNNQKCAELFCRTLAELNAVSLKQMEGLLNLAASAVQSVNTKSSANGAAELVEELKRTFEAISREARLKEEEIYENIKNSISPETEQSFCAAVEEKLITALENSLANQQQLNVTGNAILAQAAARLLSSVSPDDQS